MKKEPSHLPATTIDNDLLSKVEASCAGLIEALGIEKDVNTKDTAKRMAKMYVHEVCGGRYTERPKITTFDTDLNPNLFHSIGPITIRSLCSHHFAPVVGSAYLIFTGTTTAIGLSKWTRLFQWHAARPQMQEQLLENLIAEVRSLLDKDAKFAITLKCKHMCMTWRGVKDEDTLMISSYTNDASLLRRD